MNRFVAAVVVAFLLSPFGWWNTLLHATATTLGLNTAADEEPAPEPPAGPTSDSGASWDPIGG